MINLSKKKNIFLLVIFTTFLLLYFMGCVSALTGAPTINGTTFKEKNNNTQESALLFGFISKENTGFSSKDLPVDKIEFVQINPDIEPMFITPGNDNKDKSMNYTQPVPVGSVFKIASWDDKIGRINYGHSAGEGPGGGGFTNLYGRIYPPFDQSIIITASKPGLCYYGSYLLDKERKNFTIDNKKTELVALKLLVKKYKNTSWENMITERIKELEE